VVNSDYTVGIVVDPDFGERLRVVAGRIHTWVVDTPPNRAVAEAIWRAAPERDLERGVTTFQVEPSRSRADWCQHILPAVEDHHGGHAHAPPVSVFEIYGTALTPELRETLTELGFGDVEVTATGLVARSRPAP
jgi:hypothetical protein